MLVLRATGWANASCMRVAVMEGALLFLAMVMVVGFGVMIGAGILVLVALGEARGVEREVGGVRVEREFLGKRVEGMAAAGPVAPGQVPVAPVAPVTPAAPVVAAPVVAPGPAMAPRPVAVPRPVGGGPAKVLQWRGPAAAHVPS